MREHGDAEEPGDAGDGAFGVALRRHRRAAGLTQEALAERAGVGVRTLQGLEAGTGAPLRTTARRLAAGLGLPEAARARFLAAAAPPLRAPRGPAGARPGLRLVPSPPARPPARPGPAPPGNLPLQLTSFVGREREVAAVGTRLRAAAVRLLTLTGPGGVGKTRLALRAAADALDGYPGGAWFVPLAPLGDPALVAAAVAGVLGVRAAGREFPAAAVAAFLRGRRLLLVLDNFEHLLPAAPMVADLLAACPGLTVLATSRAALRLAGEHQLAVPPLSLPAPERPPPPDGLLRYEAPALFVQRATAARADFAVTRETAPAVAALCHRLDGLPLAIELAAARVKLLPPRALLARLDRRLAVLTGGPRDAPARHQTLRATLDWSHALLAPSERALFRRLAVFAGGCDLAAAEAVCAAGDDGPDVLAGLAALVDGSLLTPEEQSGGEPRYRLLETVREYAQEQLAAGGGEAAVRARHAAYYLALAQTGAAELRGPAQVAWLDRLEREHDNLRAALEWLAQQGRLEPALRLGGALWQFWMLRGHLSEGRARLADLLDRAEGVAGGGGRTDPAVLADALLGAGVLAALQGDVDAARSLQERSLPLWRAAGDASGVGYALYLLGNIAYDRGDLAAARPLLEEGLAAQRATGDQRGIAWIAGSLGRTLATAGEYAAARPLIEERLAICRAGGDRWGVSLALWFLANLAFDQGRPGEALALRRQALALGRELDDRYYIAPQLEDFGEAAAAEGVGERALRLAGAAAGLRAAAGTPPTAPEQARLDRWLAPVAAAGDAVRARAWAEGQAMTREDAVAYALEEAPAPTANRM